MSLSASVIDALVAAGATVEQLAAAVKADLAEEAQRRAEKRAKDAARQRKSRSSRNVTVTPCDDADAPPNDIYSKPPEPSEAKASSGSKTRKRASRTVSIQVPEWMPAEPWLAMVAMRERMHPKVQWSEDAAKGIVEKVAELRAEGHCPAKLLRKAVVSSWRTVFPGDDTRATGPSTGSTTRPMSRDELQNAIRFNEDKGNREKADEYRRILAGMAAQPPPGPVGDLIGKAARGMSANQSRAGAGHGG